MLVLIAVHLLLAMSAPLLTRLLGSRVFLAMAIAPLASGIWLLKASPAILAGEALVLRVPWMPEMGVELSFKLGLLQWVLAMIVTWIGVAVLAYCRWYFADSEQSRTAGLLTAFAGAMFGLVTADDLIVLYIFWEVTTVLSYLLIGHDPTRRANRGAAHTALIVTTFGGLAMLLGIVGLGYRAGTFSMAAILAAPPQGTLITACVLLILVGAITKSALVPFHFWLPGAMAAPTPISAYLHAAAMVKAGVYLVAVLAPAFATVAFWGPSLMILGAVTMVIGGWRALRQQDLKLLLAYGTVSQLGFMLLLVGIGTPAAAIAGLGVVIAHALFKSSLFLFVGIIDHATGTREIEQLDGIAKKAPFLAIFSALSAMSMAGLPPTVGFIAKESAFESIANLVIKDVYAVPPLAGVAMSVTVVFGSILTVAYSLRWWWGAFGNKDHGIELDWRPPAKLKVAIPALLALLGVGAGFAGGPISDSLAPYAESMPSGVPSHGLSLWQGIGWPLVMTGIAILLGVLMFVWRQRIAAIQATLPKVHTAESIYHRSLQALDRVSVWVTARTQSGSLSVYLGTILATLVLLATHAMLQIRLWPSWRLMDEWPQLMIAALMVTAGVMAAGSRGRIRALLLVGAVGYGVAMLFALHGAPDLAVTQVLVETISLIIFVLVLRKMPRYFTNRPLTSTRWWRILVALAAGLTVTLVSIIGLGSRVADPVSVDWPEPTESYGYGENIVNVALVDIRAWDTIGEISVLVISAVGVASLIFLRSRVGAVTNTAEAMSKRHADLEPDTSPGVWLRGGQTLNPTVRSVVFEVVVRVLFGPMMVISVYLLFAGHDRPGGGFAGGLVAGLALAVRYLAAGRHELAEAIPFDAGRLMGAGLGSALLAAFAPLLLSGSILQSFQVTLALPAFLGGELSLVSSTIFDLGVYLVVLGVVLDLMRSLGSGIDAQSDRHDAPTPVRDSAVALPASPGGDL